MEKALREHLPNGQFPDVSPKRSRAMSSVRSTGNRTTEVCLRLALVRQEIRGWTMHPKAIQGKPDFFFPQQRLAIFVDGCFWHGCPNCGHIPKTNSSFWQAKIRRNQERDANTSLSLETQGIQVLRFWEHELSTDLAACTQRLLDALEPRA